MRLIWCRMALPSQTLSGTIQVLFLFSFNEVLSQEAECKNVRLWFFLNFTYMCFTHIHYMFICVHVKYACLYTCTMYYMYVYVYTCTRVRIYICMHVCIHLYTYVYVCIYTYMCVYKWIYQNHKYIYTYDNCMYYIYFGGEYNWNVTFNLGAEDAAAIYVYTC